MCISTLHQQPHAEFTELQIPDESEPLRPGCLLARWFFFNGHESSVQPELWGKSHAAPAAAAAADVMGSSCPNHTSAEILCDVVQRGRNSLNEPPPSARALQRRTLFWHYYVRREMWFNSSRLSSVTRRWYNKCGRLSSLSRVKRWLSRHWIISVSN